MAVRRSKIIHEYVQSHSVRKLQIGAGANNLPGWLNTEIEPQRGQAFLDASKPFPLRDSSFEFIFSEHVIEHLSLEEGELMLRECQRILKPGGRIRIATPNLLRFVDLFRAEKTDSIRQYEEGKLNWHSWPKHVTPECVILNFQMRDFGHKFLYDEGTLRQALAEQGFERIAQYSPGESGIPDLRNLELRSHSNVRELNAYETMVFEAARK